MRNKRIALLLCLLVLLGLGTVAVTAGSEDPLLSLSYLYDTYLPKLQTLFADEAETSFRTLSENYGTRLERLEQTEGTPWLRSSGNTALELEDGGSLRLAPFGRFTMSEGTAMLHVLSGEVLDLSEGRVCEEGELLLAGHRYFAVEDSEARIRAYAPTVGFVDGAYLFQTGGSFPASEQYLDVGGHWAGSYIQRMTEAGLVNGMEAHRFEPNRKVTRAMFVTVLGRYRGVSPEAPPELSFPDVRTGDWFAPYVGWGERSGLVMGFDDGSFGPQLEITREQMALILVRYCRTFDLRLPEVGENRPFTDEDSISFWAAEAVRQAKLWGLVSGRNDGSFDPQGSATRAEMCTIICNLMDRSAAAGSGEDAPEEDGEAAPEAEKPEEASEALPPGD